MIGFKKARLSWLGWIFPLVFLSPVLFVWVRSGWPQRFPWDSFFQVLALSSWQSFLSTLVSVSLGFLGALGLLSLNKKKLAYFEVISVLPALLPELVILFSLIQITDAVGLFLEGLWGVVFVHGIMNAGLAAVFLNRVFRTKLGSLVDLAVVEGAGVLKIWLQGILLYLKKDFLLISFIIFSFAFTSFSVPLMLDEARGTTLEVFIYEKIKVEGAWSEASLLSVFQVLFIFLLSLAASSDKEKTEKPPRALRRAAFSPGIWLLVLFLGLSTFGLFFFPSSGKGFASFKENPVLESVFLQAIEGTFWVSIGVGLLTYFVGWLSLLFFPLKALQNFFQGYAAPSSVLVGFFLILVFGLKDFSYTKMILGILLISFPWVNKIFIQSPLASLKKQIRVAQSLGANSFLVFQRVVWPQMHSSLTRAGLLAAFWASGDFGLSSLVVDSNPTAALLSSTFLKSYNLFLAQFSVWLFLFCGLVSCLFLGGLAFVCGKKFNL